MQEGPAEQLGGQERLHPVHVTQCVQPSHGTRWLATPHGPRMHWYTTVRRLRRLLCTVRQIAESMGSDVLLK